jgi:hypothetical protein
MAVKYSKWPLTIATFSIKGSPKYTQIRIFGLKIYHLATLIETNISFRKATTFYPSGIRSHDP